MSERCVAMVWDKWRERRCTRNATVEGYCKQHHPDAIAARRAEREAKWEARRAEEIQRIAQRRLQTNALDALRLIAQGHNDSIGLARKTFADAGMHWDED